MAITFKRDDLIEFRSEILKGLRKYNKKFTGETHSEITNIFIMDDEEMLGGCQTEMEWNWVYIENLFYVDDLVLKAMLNALYIHYKGQVEGIFIETHIVDRVESFVSSGFKVLGTFEEKPIGYESNILVNQTMENFEVEKFESLNKYHTSIKVLDQQLEKKVNAYNRAHGIDVKRVEIEYIAYDGDQIIGGVHGTLSQDYLYVSILWVDERYRGLKIASELMDLIEKEGKAKGYHRAFLGTCTFQAKEFYEKRGYKIKMVVPNCPQGYDDFSMVKYLK
jgi:ribosomal protein S18 acetylase RimI-like enzyme